MPKALFSKVAHGVRRVLGADIWENGLSASGSPPMGLSSAKDGECDAVDHAWRQWLLHGGARKSGHLKKPTCKEK